MDDKKEKTIQGLMELQNDIVDGYITEPSDALSAIGDAISLLKAQVPRTLTLEEAEEYARLPEGEYSGKRPLYVEYHHNRKMYLKWLTAEMLHEWLKDDRINDYNKGSMFGWRCWTDIPTEKQREAVKWDE